MEFTNELFRRTEYCLALFQNKLGPEKQADDDWFEDRAAEFLWWSYGLKAQNTGRSSLDYRLKDRPDIQKAVADLLNTLAVSLKKYLHAGNQFQESTGSEENSNSSESDKSSSDSSWSEFSDEVNESRSEDRGADDTKTTDSDTKFYIETSLKMLARISIAIKRSGTKLRYSKADEHLLTHSDDDEFIQLRRHLKFLILVGPFERSLFAELARRVINKQTSTAVEIVVRSWIIDPSRVTFIQNRLIETNIVRRNRITYARRFINKRATKTQSQETDIPLPIPSQFPKAFETAREPSTFGSNAQQPIPLPVPGSMEYESPKIAKTATAKTLTATELGSQFVLPIIFPFEPKKGTPSIATKMTQTGTKQDYPACPASSGSFQCPYCVQVLTDDYTKKSRWRGHVAQDLNPYSCIYPACSDSHTLFATKEEWVKHTTSQHNIDHWVCDDCILENDQDDEFIFDSQELWESHMRSLHTCSDNRLMILRNLSKRALTMTSGCPLCKRPNKASRPDEDDHLAEHLHAWALKALPWDLNPDDQVSSDSAAMGSDDDPAGISKLSERSEDEVDREETTVSDAVDREARLFTLLSAILPFQVRETICNLNESIQKWNARNRLDAQNEIMLWHLTRLNQIREQLSHVLDTKSKNSQFTTQQQQEIEANLCAHIEVVIEFVNKVLLVRETTDEENDHYLPFPKVKGDNIPPSDVEKERLLWEGRHALNSSDISMKIGWARQVLDWIEGSSESRQDDQFDTPPRLHELGVHAMNVILDPEAQERPEALHIYSKWIELGKFGYHIDKSKAFAGYKRAAELGYARSEYRLGFLQEEYNNIPVAKQHYHRGMSLNDSASLHRMGMMALLGEYDEPRNYELAIRRLRASADMSDEYNPEGAYVYGMLMAGELMDITIPGTLLPRDQSKARVYIEKSAYLGFAKAQLKMGQAYELGQLGCDMNPALSLHYYALAARRGLPEAALGASTWFLMGSEGAFNENEFLAYKYAERAAGLPSAQYALGYFTETGVYVKTDLAEARKWYKLAAENGNKNAIARLKLLDEFPRVAGANIQ